MIVLAFALLLQQKPAAKPEISYEISFPNAVHHEAEVSVTYTGLPAKPLELRMSRSSPGRYALHEFAKNVYNVRAVDKAGQALRITRPNEHQWNVSGHKGYVRVTYTLFGDRADGTYAGIDNTHAHLNIPATFMFARGTMGWPIRVRFTVPTGSNWKVATQLGPTSDPFVYTAPGFQYFADSPTELSNWTERRWTVDGKTIRLTLHHLGTEAQVDTFTDGIKRVVNEQRAIYGELPRYDYGVYTFVADYTPWSFGDGMEHRNSTSLTSSGSLANNRAGLLGTVSHEYFHSWNVERIRPESLEPFDFERANMSGELWMAEGFTQYYGPLALKRAGLTSLDDFARQSGFNAVAVLTAPGRKFFSAVEMAMQAPFVDAAQSIDAQNKPNTFISYYTYGAAIALGLDLTLRTEKDETLDGFMRLMWRKYGKTEIPYTLDDWRTTLGQYARDTRWADDFFNRHIAGKEPIDFAPLLAKAGLVMRKAAPGTPTLGARYALSNDSTRVTVATQTLIGTPIYNAGLDRGDVIISLDGRDIHALADVNAVVSAHKPGDKLAIVYEQRGERKSGSVVVGESDAMEVVTFEKAGMTVTPEIVKLREEWLGSKAQ